MTSIHINAVVGPDGTLDLHVPNLPPGARVSVTIEVPGVPDGAAEEGQVPEQACYHAGGGCATMRLDAPEE